MKYLTQSSILIFFLVDFVPISSKLYQMQTFMRHLSSSILVVPEQQEKYLNKPMQTWFIQELTQLKSYNTLVFPLQFPFVYKISDKFVRLFPNPMFILVFDLLKPLKWFYSQNTCNNYNIVYLVFSVALKDSQVYFSRLMDTFNFCSSAFYILKTIETSSIQSENLMGNSMLPINFAKILCINCYHEYGAVDVTSNFVRTKTSFAFRNRRKDMRLPFNLTKLEVTPKFRSVCKEFLSHQVPVCDSLTTFTETASSYFKFRIGPRETSDWNSKTVSEVQLLNSNHMLYNPDYRTIRKSDHIYYAIYCESRLNHSKSGMYLLRPFSTEAWILIVVLMLLSSCVLANFKFNAICKSFLQIFGLIIKQSSTIHNKATGAVILGFLIIGTLYDALVTSFSIKPFPVKIFSTVGELLQNNFKFYFCPKIEDFSIYEEYFNGYGSPTYALHALFYPVVVGLTERSIRDFHNSYVLYDIGNEAGHRVDGHSVTCGYNTRLCLLETKYNLVLHFESAEIETSLIEIQAEVQGKKFCHVVPEQLSNVHNVWAFSKFLHIEMYEFALILYQAGILNKWDVNYNWLNNYQKFRSIRIPVLKGFKNDVEEIMRLTGYILHPFIMLMIGLGFGTITAVFEVLLPKMMPRLQKISKSTMYS